MVPTGTWSRRQLRKYIDDRRRFCNISPGMVTEVASFDIRSAYLLLFAQSYMHQLFRLPNISFGRAGFGPDSIRLTYEDSSTNSSSANTSLPSSSKPCSWTQQQPELPSALHPVPLLHCYTALLSSAAPQTSMSSTARLTALLVASAYRKPRHSQLLQR